MTHIEKAAVDRLLYIFLRVRTEYITCLRAQRSLRTQRHIEPERSERIHAASHPHRTRRRQQRSKKRCVYISATQQEAMRIHITRERQQRSKKRCVYISRGGSSNEARSDAYTYHARAAATKQEAMRIHLTRARLCRPSCADAPSGTPPWPMKFDTALGQHPAAPSQ